LKERILIDKEEIIKNLEIISEKANKYSTKNDFDFDPSHELINSISQYNSITEWLSEIKEFMTDENDIVIINNIINDMKT
jgi:hypothetical protein